MAESPIGLGIGVEDFTPELVEGVSIDLGPISTPPILDWIDISLEISPQNEPKSLIPF
jgi:hypothetical protein